MNTETHIVLGKHYDNYINAEISSGRYSSANEVIRAALRLLEVENTKLNALVNELKAGEDSPKYYDFDHTENLQKLHSEYL